jgi:signal transduction histidine kinase
LSTPQPDVILVQDDGPGVPAARLQALRHGLGQALTLAPAASTDNRSTPALGLGLMLAEMVARAHGGSLRLPEVAHGFAVELHLGPAVPQAADTPPTSPPT